MVQCSEDNKGYASNNQRVREEGQGYGEDKHTANEGPVRIQYKCLVPIYVIPEMKLLFTKHNYNVLSTSSYTHISVRDLYISRIGLTILLQEIRGLILGIYKSLTDT